MSTTCCLSTALLPSAGGASFRAGTQPRCLMDTAPRRPLVWEAHRRDGTKTKTVTYDYSSRPPPRWRPLHDKHSLRRLRDLRATTILDGPAGHRSLLCRCVGLRLGGQRPATVGASGCPGASGHSLHPPRAGHRASRRRARPRRLQIRCQFSFPPWCPRLPFRYCLRRRNPPLKYRLRQRKTPPADHLRRRQMPRTDHRQQRKVPLADHRCRQKAPRTCRLPSRPW